MSDDLWWMSAGGLARAIAGKEIASREALDAFVARVEALDGPVNSVVAWDLERARAAAAEADEAVASGSDLGPLHGVPFTVKDSFETQDWVTTAGAPELADHVPATDSVPVAKLRGAGAIPFAKTNLPIWAGDIQSYNNVYGTTNNPHDVGRTPGGSSGGSAAALAMGFTPMELGSDIGGSIRTPAHYSGVMGHKPSFGIVPYDGHIPGMPGMLSKADLAVAGPMARDVGDLSLLLELLVGPDRWLAPGWRVELPPESTAPVEELRVAAWLDDEHCPVDTATARLLGGLIDALVSAGVHVDAAARPAMSLERISGVFFRMLFAALAGAYSADAIEAMSTSDDEGVMGLVKRTTAVRHRAWLSDNERRTQMRARWDEFFTDFDVLLLPAGPRGAIEHDHSMPQFARRVLIDGVDRPYTDLFTWIAPAGLAYLPATVVPVGLDDDGLPIGVQVVAPFLHDLTALRVAGLVADHCGGCPRPALAS